MAQADIPLAAAPARAALGLWACTALVVGNMIGSGIFLLPATLASFGGLALAGWIVTGFGAIVLALIFGRLARLSSRSGGPYAYVREGFGDFAGFLIAWGYWIALWSGNAAVAVAFAGYLAYLVPALGASPLAGAMTAMAAIWGLTWVNIRGVREAGLVQIVTTVLKLAPLFALILFGLWSVEPAHFTGDIPVDMSPVSVISACAALTLWAFVGLESATVPAGEVESPKRTIPRATILGTLLAALVYIGVTLVAFGVVSPAELAGRSAPLADVAERLWGPAGASAVAIGAVVSTLGALNGFTMLTGQLPLAAARDGLFPWHFARRTRVGTPGFGLVVSSVLASLLILMSFSHGLARQFEFIILLATLSTLIPYLLCALSEILICAKQGRRLSGGVWTLGGLGFVYALWAIFGAGAEVVFWGLLLLLAGVPVHVWLHSQKTLFDTLEND